MQVIKQAKKAEENQVTPLNLPESCLACRSLEVMTQPVYLTEFDGKITQAGHVARCLRCGHIKHYGVSSCIGRIRGRMLVADFENWEVLRRNNIRRFEWEEAVLQASRNKGRMIWLDARNGLLPAEPDGRWKKVITRWEGLVNGRREF